MPRGVQRGYRRSLSLPGMPRPRPKCTIRTRHSHSPQQRIRISSTTRHTVFILRTANRFVKQSAFYERTLPNACLERGCSIASHKRAIVEGFR